MAPGVLLRDDAQQAPVDFIRQRIQVAIRSLRTSRTRAPMARRSCPVTLPCASTAMRRMSCAASRR
jgi:hypothetical protein